MSITKIVRLNKDGLTIVVTIQNVCYSYCKSLSQNLLFFSKFTVSISCNVSIN